MMSGAAMHSPTSGAGNPLNERLAVLSGKVFAPTEITGTPPLSEPAELIAETRRELLRASQELSPAAREIMTRAMMAKPIDAEIKEIKKLSDSMLQIEAQMKQIAQMMQGGAPSVPTVLEINNALSGFLENVRKEFFPDVREGDPESDCKLIFAFRRYRDELLKTGGFMHESEALLFDEIYRGLEGTPKGGKSWTESLERSLKELAPLIEQARSFAMARTADPKTNIQLEPIVHSVKICLEKAFGESLTEEDKKRIEQVGAKYLQHLVALGSKQGPRTDDIAAKLQEAFGKNIAMISLPDGSSRSVLDILPRQLESYRLKGVPSLVELEKLLVVYKQFADRKSADSEVPESLKALMKSFDSHIGAALREGVKKEIGEKSAQLYLQLTPHFAGKPEHGYLLSKVIAAKSGEEADIKAAFRWIYKNIRKHVPAGEQTAVKDSLRSWVRKDTVRS